MEKKNEINHSQKFLRQRKFLLLLPLLVLPFFTFIGYSMGVIGNENPATQKVIHGFNLNLPDAAPGGDSNWNKLKFYEKADKDSAMRLSLEKSDPYYAVPVVPVKQRDSGIRKVPGLSYNPYPEPGSTEGDANEQRVYKKLAELDKELHRKEATPVTGTGISPSSGNPDVDRLERMMATVNADDASPELNQINGLLDKILDVQHPDRVRDKIKEKSVQQKTSVFPVSVQADEVNVSLLANGSGKDSARIWHKQGNGFYGLDNSGNEQSLRSAIRAVVPQSQALVNGATVQLMLTDDVYIKGDLIPKYTFIYGIVSIGGERLQINITSLQYNSGIYPVSLAVYDLDGLEGIYIPGSITRDVSKESTDQAIQSLGIASLDPSLGAQAAGAGLQAAKTLIGRKTKLIRVNIPIGYEVLLFDRNMND